MLGSMPAAPPSLVQTSKCGAFASFQNRVRGVHVLCVKFEARYCCAGEHKFDLFHTGYCFAAALEQLHFPISGSSHNIERVQKNMYLCTLLLYHIHICDINTTRPHVGGDEYARLAAAEFLHNSVALVLGHVTVDASDGEEESALCLSEHVVAEVGKTVAIFM